MHISMIRTVFSTTVTIPIIIDQISEPIERFELAIVQSEVRNALLQKPVGVISILDDEPGEVLSCCPNAGCIYVSKLLGVISYAVDQFHN